MSKALLIMDMPESCSRCPFMYEFNGFKKCHLLNCLCMTNSILSVNEFTKKRVEKCPLLELPEVSGRVQYKNKENKGLIDIYNEGWNACIDAIAGK